MWVKKLASDHFWPVAIDTIYLLKKIVFPGAIKCLSKLHLFNLKKNKPKHQENNTQIAPVC